MLTWWCALPNVDGKSSVAWAPLTWRTVNGPNYLAVSLNGMSFGVCLESNHTKLPTLSVAGRLRLASKCPKLACDAVMWSAAAQWRIFIRLEMAAAPMSKTSPGGAWADGWPNVNGTRAGKPCANSKGYTTVAVLTCVLRPNVMCGRVKSHSSCWATVATAARSASLTCRLALSAGSACEW